MSPHRCVRSFIASTSSAKSFTRGGESAASLSARKRAASAVPEGLRRLRMRLVVVSNRLPVVVAHDDHGPGIRPGSGGLITALGPVLRRCGGVWIGWSGNGDGAGDSADLECLLKEHAAQIGFELIGVPMSREEVAGFYQGFCN